MYITQLGGHTITVCAFCDLLISNKVTNPGEAIEKLHAQLGNHLDQNSECRAYYDALPTFEDVRGILKPDTDGGA